jgi:ABC-type dipeptide/oligopeptide/nickel transport system permease component
MPPALRYALKRLLFVPFGLFIVISLSFAVVNVIPSDPARETVGVLATERDVIQARHQLGLDQSFWHRYVEYVRGIFHGDLGHSYYSERSVWSDIVTYLPNTLELIVLSLIVATTLGVGIGLLGARFRSGPPDVFARGFIMVGQAVPDFFLALLLIFVLFYKLHWVTAPTGRLGLLDIPPPTRTHALILDCLLAGDWTTLRSALAHAVLPVLTLGTSTAAILAKTTRSVVGSSFDSHQVEFARACGLPERAVFGYALRAARTPIITYGVILFSALLGGAAIVEQIFSWNGIGQFALDRMQHLDLPEMQGIVLVLGVKTLIVLVLLDLVVIFLDPRVSYE